MIRIVIVGAGRGGSEVLRVLHEDKDIHIVGIVDNHTDAPGFVLAEKLGIPVAERVDCLIEYDLAINVTGRAEVADEIRRSLPDGAEIIGGASARFFYDLIMKRQAEKEHVSQMLTEIEHLNHLSRQLNTMDQLTDMLTMVLEECMKVADTPSGSISLYDRQENTLSLAVSAGFSDAFDEQPAWEVRPNGLTERILASRLPFYVTDVMDDQAGFQRNAILEQEGVMSLVAVPLLLNDVTVGILYVDDFKPRPFHDDQLRMLSLFAGEAAHAIQKARLIKALRKEKEGLKTLNENLESTIIARTEDLTRTNEELVRASQAKSQFISNMSHELRTPLTSINGFSELLLDELFGEINDQQRTYLGNILTSGKHLLDLINGILDMAKIESGRMGLDLECLDVSRIMDDVMKVLEGYAVKASVKLKNAIDTDLPPMQVDRVKFKQILYNLCSNAIKFSPEGGEVEIQAHLDEEDAIGDTEEPYQTLKISVIDHGIGIAPEDVDRVFQPFEQVESDHARRFEGTGLGLSLTTRLVELHGGQIRLDSVVGEGSCFSFTLPVDNTSVSPRIAAMKKAQVAIASPTADASTADVDVVHKPMPVEPDAPLILVVDDDANSQELATLYLTEAGYRVCRASNGDEALARARADHPFLIMLDVMMPGKDGWEVLQELKLDADTANIPVMMCSVAEGQELGMALGATDYLSKPIDRKQLSSKLGALSLGRKKSGQTVHVLVVDDDPKILQLYEASLATEHYRVHTAGNGQEALSMAEAMEPDVILLDLMMPEMDGFAVVKELKEHPRLNNIPIIVVTAKDLTVAERMQLAGNVEDLVSKDSFTKETLLAQVHHFEQVYPQQAGLQDSVTGLLNHRYLQLRLSQEIGRAKRAEQRFSCVLFDLDNFHQFCSEAGQAHAHTALHKIGEILTKGSRGSDVASRYRIDEFAMVLAGTDQPPAMKVAARYRNTIEHYPFPQQEVLGEHGLTVSAGVAVYPDDGDTPEALMQACQHLVRVAKERGKNGVAYYNKKKKVDIL